MSLDFLVKAASAWGKIQDVQLGNINHELLASFAGMFGHDLSNEQGAALLTLLSKEDADITFSNFVQGGGLFNLITGQKGAGSAGEYEHITRCPFCDEAHVA